MKKIYAFIIVIMIFSRSITQVNALSWEHKNAGDNLLDVEGECTKDEVHIYLYPQDSDEYVYSAGSNCIEGKFHHTDNLAAWKLKEGNYEIVVADGTDQKDFKKGNEVVVSNNSIIAEGTPQEKSTAPTEVLGETTSQDPLTGSVTEFSNSIKQMRESLTHLRKSIQDSSVHSQGSKLILNGMLGVLDEKIGYVEDLFGEILTALVGSFTTEPVASPVPLNNPTPSVIISPSVTPAVTNSP